MKEAEIVGFVKNNKLAKYPQKKVRDQGVAPY